MPEPLVLFAHGAGLASSSPWMQRWKGLLGSVGIVETFDYPYMRAGRKAPDRPAVLIEAHREALDAALARHGPRPVVLVGKSMGSRMGCHLATEPDVRSLVPAIVCLGYPLVGAGKKGSVRDEVLLSLRTPILFVQGTRDPLCPLDLLDGVRARMKAPNEVYVVEGGDHSLLARKVDLAPRGLDQDRVEADVAARIVAFVRRQVDPEVA